MSYAICQLIALFTAILFAILAAAFGLFVGKPKIGYLLAGIGMLCFIISGYYGANAEAEKVKKSFQAQVARQDALKHINIAAHIYGYPGGIHYLDIESFQISSLPRDEEIAHCIDMERKVQLANPTTKVVNWQPRQNKSAEIIGFWFGLVPSINKPEKE